MFISTEGLVVMRGMLTSTHVHYLGPKVKKLTFEALFSINMWSFDDVSNDFDKLLQLKPAEM